MSESIDLFAALSVKETRSWKSGRRKAADRVVIDVKAPDIQFRVDEGKIAAQLLGALESHFREQLLAGLAPDGSHLPAPAASTLKRREYREKQAARGGELAERYKDSDFRTQGRKNWNRRFRAPSLGYFVPGQMVPKGKFGVESGMLAHSLKGGAEGGIESQGGGKWRLYFAGPRGNIDAKGGSAVSRVFSRLSLDLSLWTRTPKIQAVLKNIQKQIFGHRVMRLVSEATETVQSVTDLGEDEGNG